MVGGPMEVAAEVVEGEVMDGDGVPAEGVVVEVLAVAAAAAVEMQMVAVGLALEEVRAIPSMVQAQAALAAMPIAMAAAVEMAGEEAMVAAAAVMAKVAGEEKVMVVEVRTPVARKGAETEIIITRLLMVKLSRVETMMVPVRVMDMIIMLISVQSCGDQCHRKVKKNINLIPFFYSHIQSAVCQKCHIHSLYFFKLHLTHALFHSLNGGMRIVQG